MNLFHIDVQLKCNFDQCLQVDYLEEPLHITIWFTFQFNFIISRLQNVTVEHVARERFEVIVNRLQQK